MTFPVTNMKVFIAWRDNVEREVEKLKRQGYEIPGKAVKKVLMRGFMKINNPAFLRNPSDEGKIVPELGIQKDFEQYGR